MEDAAADAELSPSACGKGLDPIEGRLRSNIRNMIEATLGKELNGFFRCLRHRRDGGGREGMPPRALRHPGHGYAWHTETARSPG